MRSLLAQILLLVMVAPTVPGVVFAAQDKTPNQLAGEQAEALGYAVGVLVRYGFIAAVVVTAVWAARKRSLKAKSYRPGDDEEEVAPVRLKTRKKPKGTKSRRPEDASSK